MRAGRLRHKIEIQRPVETDGSMGSVVSSWQTFTQCRASYEPKTAKETYQANQDFAQSEAMFRTRFVPGVTPKMRLIFDGRTFDILGVIDVYGRGREMQIMCKENV